MQKIEHKDEILQYRNEIQCCFVSWIYFRDAVSFNITEYPSLTLAMVTMAKKRDSISKNRCKIIWMKNGSIQFSECFNPQEREILLLLHYYVLPFPLHFSTQYFNFFSPFVLFFFEQRVSHAVPVSFFLPFVMMRKLNFVVYTRRSKSH